MYLTQESQISVKTWFHIVLRLLPTNPSALYSLLRKTILNTYSSSVLHVKYCTHNLLHCVPCRNVSFSPSNVRHSYSEPQQTLKQVTIIQHQTPKALTTVYRPNAHPFTHHHSLTHTVFLFTENQRPSPTNLAQRGKQRLKPKCISFTEALAESSNHSSQCSLETILTEIYGDQIADKLQ